MGQIEPSIPDYVVEIVSDWASFEARWSKLADASRASPFQRVAWLHEWYAILAKARQVEPCLVAIRDSATGADLLLLPLAIRHRGPLRVVEFADLGVTDYNAPLVTPAFPRNELSVRRVWEAILQALDAYDAVRLLKMPLRIGPSANPLAELAECRPAKLRGWSVRTKGDWASYVASLQRPKRKELERSGRLFDKAGPGRFFKAGTLDEARLILAMVDECQVARFEHDGVRHVLRDEGCRELYESVITGVSDGSVMVTALELDGEIVAGLIALADRPRLTTVRIGSKTGDLSRIGLGRLLLWRTMAAMHAEGYTHFDFSVGDGQHKTSFRATPEPLCELVQSTSLLGMSYVAALKLKEGWSSRGQLSGDRPHDVHLA